jgi:uncharacterized membrane protein
MPKKDQRLLIVWVVSVLCAGVLLRIWGLDDKLIWHDEVYTSIFAAGYSGSDWGDALYTGVPLNVADVLHFQTHNPERSVGDTILALAQDEPQHPPLYYVLARSWVSLTGSGIGGLRVLSALLSLLGLPAMYWFCRELFASRRVAWTGVMLLASSPFFVLYAQEAREYALWAVLLLACSAALLRAARLSSDPERSRLECLRAWLVYSALTTGALYTSFSTALVVLVHLLWLVPRLGDTRLLRHSAGAMAVAALLFSPWAFMLWTHIDAFQASMAWASNIQIPAEDLLRTFALNLSRPLVDFWAELQGWPAWIGVGAAVVLVLLGLVRLKPDRGARTMLLLLVLVPVGMLLGPDLVLGGIRSLSTRYLTPALLGILVAVAGLLGAKGDKWHLLGTAGVVVLGLLSCGWNHTRPAPWTKGISRGLPAVSAAINAEARPLVVGNREQHHPGNLLALANRLRPDSQMVFLSIGKEDQLELPAGGQPVFLFSPTLPTRERLIEREGVRLEPVIEQLHLQLWRVVPQG